MAWYNVKKWNFKKIPGNIKDTAGSIIDEIGDAASWVGKEAYDICCELLTLGLDPVVISIILSYYGSLKIQARGKMKKLPSDLIQKLQPYFSVNLNNIEYADGINTGHGMSITFGDQIFFTGQNSKDQELMIHEIIHSQQYKTAGGLVQFLHKYVGQILKEVIEERTFNVHKILPLEKAATERADQLAKIVSNNQPYNSTISTSAFSVGMNLF